MKKIIILFVMLISNYLEFSAQVYNNSNIRDSVFVEAFSQIDSNLFYFPTRMFHNRNHIPALNDFKVNWYSKQLIALKEPIIFRDSSRKEIYRFTWLRTFHNPIAIRLERLDDDYKIYWKKCNGAGGYSPGKLIVDSQKTIDKNTWDSFIHLLDQIHFWELNSEEESMGTDGSQWILEGKKSNQYHVVDRWTPKDESNYFKCCDFLIRLTDLVIPSKDKY